MGMMRNLRIIIFACAAMCGTGLTASAGIGFFHPANPISPLSPISPLNPINQRRYREAAERRERVHVEKSSECKEDGEEVSRDFVIGILVGVFLLFVLATIIMLFVFW